MIEHILDDIHKTVSDGSSGGITEVKQLATSTYKVSISKHKRVEQYTYILETKKNCEIKILKKTESIKTMGPKNK